MTAAGIFALAAQGQSAPATASVAEDVVPALRQILADAVTRAPDAVSGAISVAQSVINVESAKAALYPHFSLNANYSWSTGAALGEVDPVTKVFQSESGNPFADTGPWTTSSGLGYSVGFGQRIFEWGSIMAGINVAKIAEESARIQFADNYRRLALSLREQFLGLIYKKAALRVARQNRDDAARVLQARRDDVAAGAAPATLNQATVADMDSQIAVARAEQAFAYSKQVFVRMAGLTELADSAIPDDLPRLQIAQAAPVFASGGPAATFQGRLYSNYIKQADLYLKQAKTNYLPKFSAGASYGVGFNTSVTGNLASRSASVSGSANIGFGWSIWDGFATRASVRSSLAARRASEIQLRNFIDSTNEQIENLRDTLVLAGRDVASAEFKSELAEGSLNTLRANFGTVGGPTQDNIDSAAATLRNAQLAVLGARASYLTRSAEYRSLAGTDPILQNLPAEYQRAINGR